MADDNEDGNVDTPPHALTQEEFSAGLSEPALTLDASGIAFTKLNVSNKHLSGFGETLTKAPFVRFIDANNNQGIKKIVPEEVTPCKELITLSAAGCSITKLGDFSANKHLQHLDLTANLLVSLKTAKLAVGTAAASEATEEDGAEKTDPATQVTYVGDASDPEPEFTFAAPSLLVLLLNRNKLTSFDGLNASSFRNLTRIEAANNEISSFNFPEETLPALEELILPRNKLTTLEGITRIPKLRVLNVDFNEITSLAAIIDVVKGWDEEAVANGKQADLSLGSLRVLSVKTNSLPEDAWANIDGLRPITSLREIRISGNPLANSAYKPRQLELKLNLSAIGGEDDDEDIFSKLNIPEVGPLDIKLELIVRVPQLTKIEDELVTPGERRTATEEREKRKITEAALEKAAKEAAERAAKAAEDMAAAAGEGDEGEEDEEQS